MTLDPKCILRFALIIAYTLSYKPLLSAQLSVNLFNKITVNTDFRQGRDNQPAVMLVHGFMGTYNLNIIQLIADELEDHGYTVIAPTLSLQINNRRTSMSCDAIHTHTMESDIDELARWVAWLRNKGYQKVILVGFSTGSLQTAIYLSLNPDPIVKQAVLISPAYLAGPPFPQAEEMSEISLARQMLENGNIQLHEFNLSYCKGDFVTTAKVFLSYKKWTQDQFLQTVQHISIPYSIIIGEDDHRYGTRLIRAFQNTQSNLITIPNANHFFDSPNEFELLDKLIQTITLQN